MLRRRVPYPEILISLRYLRTSDNSCLRLFTHYFNIEHNIQGSVYGIRFLILHLSFLLRYSEPFVPYFNLQVAYYISNEASGYWGHSLLKCEGDLFCVLTAWASITALRYCCVCVCFLFPPVWMLCPFVALLVKKVVELEEQAQIQALRFRIQQRRPINCSKLLPNTVTSLPKEKLKEAI